MAKNGVLNMDAMEESFFEDTALVGIVTALPAYRFCWMLNNHFDINFFRDPDQTLSLKKRKLSFFSQFMFTTSPPAPTNTSSTN